jgi:hypothetical protein
MMRGVAIASAVALIVGATPVFACTILVTSEELTRQLEQERENAMIDGADLVYFGKLWNSGGLTRERYAIRGEQTIRGGRAPVYAQTSPRYETSCGREPIYSLDGVRRILPGQPVIVVARRRSWWRIEILEVARRDSIRGRRLYSLARSRAYRN